MLLALAQLQMERDGDGDALARAVATDETPGRGENGREGCIVCVCKAIASWRQRKE